MKKWFRILLPAMIICVAVACAVIIGIVYFNFMSRKIFDDSTTQLKEIYGQVNHSFDEFMRKNWGLLDNYSLYFEKLDKDEIADFVIKEKDDWKYSDLYFISSQDGSNMSASGISDLIEISGVSDMSGPVLATGVCENDRYVIFAIPVAEKTIGTFEYNALAISYTDDMIVKSLKSEIFGGQAYYFITDANGKTLLTNQEKYSSLIDNYLDYLSGAEVISDAQKQKIKNDLANGNEGLLRCKQNDADQILLYQPIGYGDYSMLSIVPESAISAGFMSVQATTIFVLIGIFILIGAAIIALIVWRAYRTTHKSKTELKYREKMFDLLSSTVDDIFIMYDPQTKVTDYISPNLERLLGVPAKDVCSNVSILKTCTINYSITLTLEELENIPLNGSKSWECEYMHQKTGERRWYRVTIYPMQINNVKKYITVMSDRTHEQQMTQKLSEALDAAKSANEAKSNFLSNMSHDIRTPMNAIVGFSVLLDKDAGNIDKVREYTRKIMASSHHMLSLINDVLDMSKIESGKTLLNVDRFSLPELLDELNTIVLPQVKAKHQNFAIKVKGVPPEQIMGDKLRLNQILLNLLSNAIKYTPDGGSIEFMIKEMPKPSDQFVKLQFSVKDNGIGMSEQFQKEIFNPFSREINSVTNKIQGTGLGMAITKNLVDLMGGVISLESAPGKGSVFTIEMSFALPESEESDSWFRHKITRMLVADDEEDICIGIKDMMRDTGVDVSYALSGADAVKCTVTAHKNKTDYDVILLDWKMPEMDGVETAKQIRKSVGKDVPILVLTSYDWTDIEDEARKAGISAFLPKPFFVSSFWQTIKPLFIKEDSMRADKDNEYANALKDKNFLVVEDNELNAEIFGEMLSMEGANFELATNGEEAVELFEKDPQKYDLIFMDVQMPVMNGYEATRKIRSLDIERAKNIPIVAMTANTFAEDIKCALDSGMNGHLAKPIDMNSVRELTAKLLNKAQGE